MSININMLYYPTETVSFMVILSRRVNPFSHFHADFSMALSCEEVETGSARLYACSIFQGTYRKQLTTCTTSLV